LGCEVSKKLAAKSTSRGQSEYFSRRRDE